GGAVGYDGPVLAIAGDYGLQYTIQELGTAAELELSLPILIWDNDALAEIRDCMIKAQIAPNAVTQVNPDWNLLAQAYGCEFAEPGSIEELCVAVNDGFGAGRPTLIRATPGGLA
ncbi:MAG: thiamine pyrophosphate-dependent enzyme, partial [Boseongicola sp.]